MGGHYFLDQEALLKDFMRDTGLTPTRIFHCVNALHIPKFDRRNQNIIVKSGYVIDRKRLAGRLLAAHGREHLFGLLFLSGRYPEDPGEVLPLRSSPRNPRSSCRSTTGRTRSADRSGSGKFYDHLADLNLSAARDSIELVYVYMPLVRQFQIGENGRQIGGRSGGL